MIPTQISSRAAFLLFLFVPAVATTALERISRPAIRFTDAASQAAEFIGYSRSLQDRRPLLREVPHDDMLLSLQPRQERLGTLQRSHRPPGCGRRRRRTERPRVDRIREPERLHG